jgi:hypothetical protein
MQIDQECTHALGVLENLLVKVEEVHHVHVGGGVGDEVGYSLEGEELGEAGHVTHLLGGHGGEGKG